MIRALLEALTAFLKALSVLATEFAPLIREHVHEKRERRLQETYHARRKDFADALQSGDPVRLAAAFAALDELLLARGVGLPDAAAERGRGGGGNVAAAAAGDADPLAGRQGDVAGQGVVDRAGGLPEPHAPDPERVPDGVGPEVPVTPPEVSVTAAEFTALLDRVELKVEGRK